MKSEWITGHLSESMQDNINIIFFGTPEFAVPSLKTLVDSGFKIVGVVTNEDKPSGRGQKISESAIKICAINKNLNVIQPTKLRDPEFIKTIQDLEPDLIVVVAFRKLPEEVWKIPPLGTINLHSSLLPNYRGAAPINWVIINGEKETGVTTFFINDVIDTGEMIFQEKVDIEPDETAGQLHDKLSEIGAKLLLKTVTAIKEGNNPRIIQIYNDDYKKAPKISKEDCKIDWTNNHLEVHNFIRGLSPYPGAWALLNGKFFKIFQSTNEVSNHKYVAGTIITDNKSFMKVAVKDGYVNLLAVQIEGKRKMAIRDFLKGTKVYRDSML